MAVDRSQRLRLRGASALALCAAAAALLSAPYSALFASPNTKVARAKESASTAKDARKQKFMGSDKFLKFLVSQDTIYANQAIKGIAEIMKATDTNLEMSRLGDYYPYSKHSKKVAIIGGKQDNIMKAFRALFKNAAGRDTVHMTFLVPKGVAGKLIGEGGATVKALGAEAKARIFVKSAPNGEEQVEVLGNKGPAFDKVAEWLLAEMDADSMKNSLRVNYQGGKKYLPSTIYLKASDAVIAKMIGKEGKTKNKLEHEFNVDLSFDKRKDDSSERTVKIKGALGDVQAIHQVLVAEYIEQ